MFETQYALPPHGGRLAYRVLNFEGAQHKPALFFLGGFAASMDSTKAQYITQYAHATQTNCVLFDYFGHGQSDGEFTDGTIGRWLADALHIFQGYTQGPQICVGSSMGGWLMLLLAQKQPQRIAKLVGLAASPGFTERMYGYLPADQQAELQKAGHITFNAGTRDYKIAYQLITEARQHLISHPIQLDCPVHLFHGLADEISLPEVAHELLPLIQSPATCLTLVADADHGLSRPQDFALWRRALHLP